MTALHLASEKNFYTIVDLLFQYKADIFQLDQRGNTPFTGLSNNLLMIKLMKKEQKAFFDEKYRQRLQPREMHLTNNTFLGHAFKSHPKEDPILAQFINSKYHSL